MKPQGTPRSFFGQIGIGVGIGIGIGKGGIVGFGHEKIEVYRAGEDDTDSDSDPEKTREDTEGRESVFSEVSDIKDFLCVLRG